MNNDTAQPEVSSQCLTLGLSIRSEGVSSSASLTRQIQELEGSGLANLWIREALDPSARNTSEAWRWMAGVLRSTCGLKVGFENLHPFSDPLPQIASRARYLASKHGQRFLLGIAGGENGRATRFIESFLQLRKELAENVPLFVNGYSHLLFSTMAQGSDGWITHPRPLPMQRRLVDHWKKHALAREKPALFVQTLCLDLSADPREEASSIHLGYRLGAIPLRKYLRALKEAGVSHVILNLDHSRRPVRDVLAELREQVFPRYKVGPELCPVQG